MILKYIHSLMAGALFTVAAAQAPFEGIIRFKTENKAIAETAEVTWFLKNGNSRLDIRSNTPDTKAEMSLYFPKGAAQASMVSTDNGKTTVYPLPYSAFADADFSKAFGATATGRTETVAGFTCEEYTMQTAEGSISCLVSRESGISAGSFPSVILGRGIFGALMQSGVQGIPLKIVSRDFSGNIVLDQEVISVEPGSVSDTRFAVPSLR